MDEVNRRRFVVLAGGAAACACLLGCGTGVRADDSADSGQVAPARVGAKGDYATAGIYDRWIEPLKLVLVSDGRRLHAMSAICPHKGCTVKMKQGDLACPCHGSHFAPDGQPTRGPARSALMRFGIAVDDGDRIVVDLSQRYPQSQWDDPGAWVSL